MKSSEKTVLVYGQYDGKDVKIGKLYIGCQRGEESYAFEYDDDFFNTEYINYFFDYDIKPFRGRQYLSFGKKVFGVFSDSAPDRWGRLLMKRRESIIASREQRKPRKFNESDYILGVYDEARMGAIRFKEEGGEFLSDSKDMATPPWESLRTLEEASREFEKDENILEDKWIKQLIGPGSSLGGARPKAIVKDVDGSLWLAKFPSKNDEFDKGAWEKVANDLMRLCGINVQESRLIKFSNLGSTFLVRRFDRTEKGRVHFISAMTATGKADGASATDGTSYLDIVSFIKAYGGSPSADLKELYKRIIFNMAISNTDDHLRNHGFVMTKEGWRLSPAFDVNPEPEGDYLSLNVNDSDNSISIELAVDSAEYFGLTREDAKKVAKEVLVTVRDNWLNVAKKNGIKDSSIEYMRSAFSECYKSELYQ